MDRRPTAEPCLRRKTQLASAYFFLIVTAYYLIKPVRSSLVLGSLGSVQLPYLYLISALVIGTLVAWYTRLTRRFTPQQLMPSILIMLIAQLLVFHWTLPLPFAWISGMFYLWVSLFSVIAVTQFWTIVDDLFSSSEAKRTFGFIGAGGIAGGLAGSAMASALVRWIRAEDLLIIAAGLLGMCVFLVRIMGMPQPAGSLPDHHARDHTTHPSHPGPLLGYLRRFRYLRYLLVLVVVGKGVSTIIDYQFNALVELSVVGKEARTALFGVFYLGLNVASLTAQLLLTSRFLRSLGIHRTIALLPIGLAVGSISLLVIPGLAIAAMVALYDRGLNYSLGQTGKELLYVPVPSQVRYEIKPLIDAAAFRLAQGIAGVSILFAHQVGHLPVQALGLLALPLIGLWFLAIHRLRRMEPAWVRSGGS